MPALLIIAHAPLASSLKAVASHAYPECGQMLNALDVTPDMSPEQVETAARELLRQSGQTEALIFTDVFGATPCNVAQKLVDGARSRLVAGVNLPMLLRAVTYRHEPLDALVQRAVAGGTAGVMQVAVAAPQNQARRKHSDQEIRDHQQ
jgi:PTS system ascorbate-specific IIA component